MVAYLILNASYADESDIILVQNENGINISTYALWTGLWPEGHRYQIFHNSRIDKTIICQDPFCKIYPPLKDGIKKEITLSEIELLSIRKEWIRIKTKDSGCSIF